MNNNLEELFIPSNIIGDKEKSIKHCIENGKIHRELNEREISIKYFKKAISMLNIEEIDERLFKLHIEIGEMYEIDGDREKPLEYFKSAYDVACGMHYKIFQVDALVKIAEKYLSKGEIETSIKYGEMVDEVLETMNYIQGKLEISIYWIKVHYMKNEYYKAREIGNEALKLCGEEYIIYKGKILNDLGNLYSEIASADERLDLLEQALKCFEKENFLIGILGTINNIGVVYGDELQDNKKALEYFLKLKKQSECNGYEEFVIYAYINIGEIYFKLLRYKEAIVWYKEGLDKAQMSNMELMVFYTYVSLTHTNLNLYNYEEAKAYFNLASEELRNHPDQGKALPWYYEVASILSLQFGKIKKAKVYIKKALELIGNEESMIKWSTGIVYEFIKLKEAKNNTEILDALDGIRYLLLKYKNPEEILDIVNKVGKELKDLGYRELAFKLVDEYKYTKLK